MTTDGRIARRQRNQDTVLDAVVELFESGNSDPAVEEVAEWSGVSTRSIYRYFHHRDGLIDAAMWHLVATVEREMPLQIGSGALPERIQRFVDHRLAVHQRLAPLMRASNRSVHVGEQAGVQPGEQTGAGEAGPAASRSIFLTSATECFAAEFAELHGFARRRAEVITEVALQFGSLEFLVESLDGDLVLVADVLVRHLSDQMRPSPPLDRPY